MHRYRRLICLAAGALLGLSGCVTARYGTLSYVEMSPPGIKPARSATGATVLKPRCAGFLNPEHLYTDIGKALKAANLTGLKNFQAGTIADFSQGISTCVWVEGEKQ